MSALSGNRKGRRLPWLTGYDQAPLAEEVPAGALRGGSRRTEGCRVRWPGAAGPERAGPPDPGAGSESRPGDWRHAAPPPETAPTGSTTSSATEARWSRTPPALCLTTRSGEHFGSGSSPPDRTSDEWMLTRVPEIQ
ncbi:hypothetical protein [Nitrosomonas sp. GH22]|uniref:hypothetical protein n=1 Tax=Nitrosomonas sp. GH22 TaxID=153947 RepID=UPI00136CCADC|nr:hypothetical protein [Nitrosomonas sp. GH22]